MSCRLKLSSHHSPWEVESMASKIIKQELSKTIKDLDNELSQRFIELDPKGYFLISVDNNRNQIVVEHYSNDIDSQGRAIDPVSGKPIKCDGGAQRIPINIFKGRTAKEIGIQLTEGEGPYPLSKIDHALYLGRELQKAETCLTSGKPYVQD